MCLGRFHLSAAKGLHEEVQTMQLTIRMPQEYKEKIETLAERMGLKKSDIARLALKEFIEGNIAADDRAPYDKVKHLIGTAKSGIKDLGQRHREYVFKVIRIR
jgi:antitoxin component of RelBE/YafQ-DinJ toxin-antitoxin module